MKTIDVGGIRLAYARERGEGRGPVVVLLNGLFQSIDRWDGVMPHLRGLDVLRYDMRGQGGSDAPLAPYAPYGPEVHAADLRALLDALDVDRYALVGLSNGGIVAQHAAIDPRPGLDKVMLVCTTAYLDVALRAKLQSWRDALDRGGVLLRMQVSLPWAFGRAFLDAHPELLGSIEASVATAPSVERHRALLDGILALDDLRDRLGEVRAPTTVISGADDLLFPPSYGEAIAARIPGASARFTILPRIGHQPPLEDPAGFAGLVRAWIQGEPS